MVLNGNVPCHQQCKCPDQDLWAPLYVVYDPSQTRWNVKLLDLFASLTNTREHGALHLVNVVQYCENSESQCLCGNKAHFSHSNQLYIKSQSK